MTSASVPYSNLDSNISTPISVNQLCDSDGNDTLPIDEKMLLRMSPIIGMVEEAMLTCGLHCAWRILFAHSINSRGK